MWYSYNKINTYNGLFNFIISNRGGGKTFGAIENGIKRFLKTGKQFMYVRRYQTEFEEIDSFFDSIIASGKFPKLEFEVVKGKTRKFLINGKCCGYYMALSVSQKKKSVSFPNVDRIYFDEFIIDKSIPYLPNEVTKFLDLYETVDRKRDETKVYFLANNVSIVNPYFTYFNIVPRENERFSVFKDGLIVVEMFTDNEYIESKKNTKFGKLISGTTYGNFAIENKSLCDNDNFILKKKPIKSNFYFSIKADSFEVGFWECKSEGIIFCNKQIDLTSNRRYTISKNNHAPNFIMISSLNRCYEIKIMKKYFSYGLLRFQDQNIKHEVYKIMGLLNIK